MRGPVNWLPSFHAEQAPAIALVEQRQHNLVVSKSRLSALRRRRCFRVNQRNDRLKPKVGLVAQDREQVRLLATVERFKDAIVEDEPGKLLIQMGAQHG